MKEFSSEMLLLGSFCENYDVKELGKIFFWSVLTKRGKQPSIIVIVKNSYV